MGYERLAWSSPDKTCRFLLGEPVVDGNNILYIGLNPSTADYDREDPTSRRIKQFTASFGGQGWLLMNLYPLKATNPDDLPLSTDEQIAADNLHTFQEALSLFRPTKIIACWGDIITKRDYLSAERDRLLAMLKAAGLPVYTIGPVSKLGHARHPLYLSGETKLLEYVFGESHTS